MQCASKFGTTALWNFQLRFLPLSLLKCILITPIGTIKEVKSSWTFISLSSLSFAWIHYPWFFLFFFLIGHSRTYTRLHISQIRLCSQQWGLGLLSQIWSTVMCRCLISSLYNKSCQLLSPASRIHLSPSIPAGPCSEHFLPRLLTWLPCWSISSFTSLYYQNDLS